MLFIKRDENNCSINIDQDALNKFEVNKKLFK